MNAEHYLSKLTSKFVCHWCGSWFNHNPIQWSPIQDQLHGFYLCSRNCEKYMKIVVGPHDFGKDSDEINETMNMSNGFIKVTPWFFALCFLFGGIFGIFSGWLTWG